MRAILTIKRWPLLVSKEQSRTFCPAGLILESLDFGYFSICLCQPPHTISCLRHYRSLNMAGGPRCESNQKFQCRRTILRQKKKVHILSLYAQLLGTLLRHPERWSGRTNLLSYHRRGPRTVTHHFQRSLGCLVTQFTTPLGLLTRYLYRTSRCQLSRLMYGVLPPVWG